MNRLKDVKGFSLIEIMVVVLVVGIALATATPSMRSFYEGHKLRSATSTLESNLRRARSAAITRDSNVRMWVFDDTNSYVVMRDNDGDGNFSIPVSRGTFDPAINAANISFGGADFVTFDSRGRPDNPGSMRLQSHSGKAFEILVAAGSGHITVEKPIESQEVVN